MQSRLVKGKSGLVMGKSGLVMGKSGLVRGDCLEVLDALPIEGKFDVVIADPPYNIGKDFGNDSDKMPLADYVLWTDQWIASCLDRLADNGVIYIYGFPEILARVAARYPVDEQRWLAWHYTNKTTPSAKFWQRSHESILCLWKPGKKRPALEIDQIREPYTEGYKSNVGRVRAGTDSRFGGSKGRETIYGNHGGALPRDVIKIPALAGGAGAAERWFMCCDCGRQVFPPSEIDRHRGCRIMKHPTQKPMELTRRLILSRISGGGGHGDGGRGGRHGDGGSGERHGDGGSGIGRGGGGRCLIPFAGSGSECVAAKQMGIEWLGIEINPEYVEFATKWLEKCAGHG